MPVKQWRRRSSGRTGFRFFTIPITMLVLTTGAYGDTPPDEGDSVREAHLTAILRDVRDELCSRRIPLVVDIFRDRGAIEAGTPTDWAEDTMKKIAEDLGIVTVDTWEPLVTAVKRGEDVYMSPEDPHFNPAGHALIAAWLHEQVPAAIATARRRNGYGSEGIAHSVN
jgi:lysophospholipase L1-like esterase